MPGPDRKGGWRICVWLCCPSMLHPEGLIRHLKLELSVSAKLLTGRSAMFNTSFPFCPLQDTVAMESMPLLGFTIAPEKEEGSNEVGPVFHLYHKKTLFYSFRAEDTNLAQRYQNTSSCISCLSFRRKQGVPRTLASVLLQPSSPIESLWATTEQRTPESQLCDSFKFMMIHSDSHALIQQTFALCCRPLLNAGQQIWIWHGSWP